MNLDSTNATENLVAETTMGAITHATDVVAEAATQEETAIPFNDDADIETDDEDMEDDMDDETEEDDLEEETEEDDDDTDNDSEEETDDDDDIEEEEDDQEEAAKA